MKDEYYEAVASVGALVEGPAFYEYMTAQENLECFAAYAGNVDKKRIKYLLELVGLLDRAKDKVKGFSLGMKQRLGIAQALLNSPELLILDEPTNGLDPDGIRDIRKLIENLSNEGITVFVSSHLLSEVQNVCNK
ncbi:ATP-binding cassette domain-containing protein, partial [Clostridium perfringens]|nr:ATP-binding cassette domain-containing protein [Clostridium perfringens]